jgi:hypothetical protein
MAGRIPSLSSEVWPVRSESAPTGDAGDPDDDGGLRSLDARRLGECLEAAAAVAGRIIEDRRERREGRFRLALLWQIVSFGRFIGIPESIFQ